MHLRGCCSVKDTGRDEAVAVARTQGLLASICSPLRVVREMEEAGMRFAAHLRLFSGCKDQLLPIALRQV